MNQTENFLLLVGVQAILFSVALCVLVSVAKRIFRAPTQGLIMSGLGVLILLWFAALIPLPNWTASLIEKTGQMNADRMHERLVDSSIGEDTTPTEKALVLENPDSRLDSPQVTPTVLADKDIGGKLQGFLNQLGTVVVSPPTEQASTIKSWKFWTAVSFGLGILIGAIRLLIALLSIRRLRHHGSLVTDSQLIEVLEVVCARLEYPHSIQVRTTDETSAAFTVGWLKPLIFISKDWKSWSDKQLEASLAHEVAHISNGDFAQRLIAQASTALHFYNPLVHLLCAQLSLEQELSADNLAAGIVGGRKSYLDVLATMALETDYPQGRLSPMFLPTRKTFFRRIEVLRKTKKSNRNGSHLSKVVGFALILAMGLTTAGLRPSLPPTLADEPSHQTGTVSQAQPLESATLNYVDSNSSLIVVTRPFLILEDPILKGLIRGIEKSGKENVNVDVFENIIGLKSHQIDQLTFIFDDPSEEANSQTMIIRTLNDGWWAGPNPEKTIMDKFDASVEQSYRGAKILRNKKGSGFTGYNNQFWHAVDAKTLVTSSHLSAIKMCIRAKNGPVGNDWYKTWQSAHAKDVASVYAGASMIELLGLQAELRGRDNPLLGSLSPLWEQTDFVLGGLQLNGENSVRAAISCGNDQGAIEVTDTINGLIPLAKNMIRAFKTQMADVNEAEQLLAIPMQVLNATVVERTNDTVSLSTKMEGDTANLLNLALPVVLKTRQKAIQVSSMNNIRQLGLAMLNYESAHQHFPPPVLVSPHGNKYSWRIAILPFMEQSELYEAYRFDEEWNSDHNAAITAQVPPVFRHPNSQSKTNACYFMVVGNETFFPLEAHGMTFGRIKDGTSNTIMLVEAKRDIHWAEPRDIPYSAKGLQNELGGFDGDNFAVALGDGSCRSLSRSLSDEIFRALLTRAAGEVFDRSELANRR